MNDMQIMDVDPGDGGKPKESGCCTGPYLVMELMHLIVLHTHK